MSTVAGSRHCLSAHSIEILESRVAPATFIVTSLADDGPGSLRAAIEEANARDGADKIVFKSGLRGSIALDASLPSITDDVKITGPGSSKLKIDADGTGRIFTIVRGPDPLDVTISGLKLTGGQASRGGAILIDDEGGSVTIKSVAITGNEAIGSDATSGGVSGAPAQGGGIFIADGRVVIVNSTISDNLAQGGDGAAGVSGTHGSSGVAGNPGVPGQHGGVGGSGQGGGIYNGGTLIMKNSLVSGNTAVGGNGAAGGTGGNGGSSTLSGFLGGNGGAGGAGGIGGSALAGGIYNAGSAWLTKVAFTDNEASAGNGGVGGRGGGGGSGTTASGFGGNGGSGGAGGTASGGSILSAGALMMVRSKVIGADVAGGTGGMGGSGGFGSPFGVSGMAGIAGTEAGGGFLQLGGNALFQSVLIHDNSADEGRGGGIHVMEGRFTGTKITIMGNTAQTGAGIALDSFAFGNVTDSKITSNKASGNGGGVSSAAELTIDRVMVTKNRAEGSGGGIYSSGELFIEKSTISKNASSPAGIPAPGTGGGGIYSTNPIFELSNSKITGNTAFGGGGGIVLDNGSAVTAMISDSVISGNSSGDKGGGILSSQSLSVERSVVSSNAAVSGGGISVSVRTVIITESTISNNKASDDGGGIRVEFRMELSNSTVSGNVAYRSGGGIHLAAGAVSSLVHTTIAKNVAETERGGGIFAEASVSLSYVTIAVNRAAVGGGIAHVSGSISVQGSIIALNKADNNPDLSGTVTGSYNLIQNLGTGVITSGSYNILGKNPRLSALGKHGGPTATMILLKGSPAIDHGMDPGSMLKDQRGVPRLLGGGTDIGAVESW